MNSRNFVNIWALVLIKISKCRVFAGLHWCYIQLPVQLSVENLAWAWNDSHLDADDDRVDVTVRLWILSFTFMFNRRLLLEQIARSVSRQVRRISQGGREAAVWFSWHPRQGEKRMSPYGRHKATVRPPYGDLTVWLRCCIIVVSEKNLMSS